jgi:broad specificity phosphatase PhoE
MMSIRRYAGISLSLLVLDGSLSPVNAQRAILLLRHAERVEYESPDGVLSEAGEARARVLARLLQDAGVTAIYTSDRKRTHQTAEPLSKALGIAPTTVAAQSQIEATLSLIREREKSGIVVIVSHSDIVPGFLKALGHPGQITIGPREHDDIFVIVPAPGGPPTVVRLNY